jgi:hypothetical protein
MPSGKVTGNSSPSENYIDYDIHGVVGVRLIDCPPLEAAAIAKTFGPLQRSLPGMPDIVVRFAERIAPAYLQYLGLNRYAFSDETLFFLSNKTEAKAAIALDRIGQSCEVICENGTSLVPLLTTLINLTALTKGCVFVHASAFEYRGTGVLLTGWKNVGMTEALLAFALHGARYVGSGWILLKDDGHKMCGMPGPFALHARHLKYLPRVRHHVNLRRRLQLKSIAWLAASQQRFPYRALDRLLPVRFLRDALPKLERQLEIKVEPQSIFSCVLGSVEAAFDKVFLLLIHDKPAIQVEPIDPKEVAERMTSSICHGQLDLFESYLAYKFAFPERTVELIESVPTLLECLLHTALAGKKAYMVLHPDRVSLPELFESMRPLCEASST